MGFIIVSDPQPHPFIVCVSSWVRVLCFERKVLGRISLCKILQKKKLLKGISISLHFFLFISNLYEMIQSNHKSQFVWSSRIHGYWIHFYMLSTEERILSCHVLKRKKRNWIEWYDIKTTTTTKTSMKTRQNMNCFDP